MNKKAKAQKYDKLRIALEAPSNVLKANDTDVEDIETIENNEEIFGISRNAPMLVVYSDENSNSSESENMLYNEIEHVKTEGDLIEVNYEISAMNDETWSVDKVNHLLALYSANFDKFRNPKIKKKTLWSEIGAELGRDAESCDKKFRNLKQHYIYLLKKKQSGKCSITWTFFHIFEDMFRNDRTIMETVQHDSKANKSELVVQESEVDCNEGIDEEPVNNEEVKKERKRRNDGFRVITSEIIKRQRNIEQKLDRLVDFVEESNNIQKERNDLFKAYLGKIMKK